MAGGVSALFSWGQVGSGIPAFFKGAKKKIEKNEKKFKNMFDRVWGSLYKPTHL